MRRAVALIAVALILAACGAGSKSPSTATTTPPRAAGTGRHPSTGFHLTSPAFRPGAPIPRVYTCDGRELSLPLQWTGVPRAAKELVLVMRDPDAPGGSFVHWALAGIAPSSTALPAGAVRGHAIPGRNSFGANVYGGPCPPRGAPAHHYVLTLSALASPSGLRPGFSPDQLRARPLAIATLIGSYARR